MNIENNRTFLVGDKVRLTRYTDLGYGTCDEVRVAYEQKKIGVVLRVDQWAVRIRFSAPYPKDWSVANDAVILAKPKKKIKAWRF